MQATQTQTALQQLDADLRAYEAGFGMTSDEFQRRFQSGDMGDRMDFIEWISLVTMRREPKERPEVLYSEKQQ